MWFVDVLDGLRVSKASLVGNSYGGYFAMNQASLTPERVRDVVAISPAAVFTALRIAFYVRMIGSVMLGSEKGLESALTWAANGLEPDPADANLIDLMRIVLVG